MRTSDDHETAGQKCDRNLPGYEECSEFMLGITADELTFGLMVWHSEVALHRVGLVLGWAFGQVNCVGVQPAA